MKPEETPGYGEHFLTFCPKHCPCGYPCDGVIGEDFKWRCPPGPRILEYEKKESRWAKGPKKENEG